MAEKIVQFKKSGDWEARVLGELSERMLTSLRIMIGIVN